jgi:hypothetical protein
VGPGGASNGCAPRSPVPECGQPGAGILRGAHFFTPSGRPANPRAWPQRARPPDRIRRLIAFGELAGPSADMRAAG